MNIDYSQFLNMIPEATLTAILLIVFLADLFTAPRSGESKVRSWFNPLVCVLMLAACILAFLFWNMGSSFFMFGLYFYFSGMMLERVFRNYMPDEDEELEEEEVEGYDLEAERQEIIDRYTGKISQNEEESK